MKKVTAWRIRHGVPITPSTVFHFGSNSKQFTAFAIFLLEEEGRLQLTDDIHQYIPEMPDFGKTITIQHLLDHTSGLRDYLELLAFAGWNYMDNLITKDLGFKYTLRQKRLNFDPGEQFMYSNTGCAAGRNRGAGQRTDFRGIHPGTDLHPAGHDQQPLWTITT